MVTAKKRVSGRGFDVYLINKLPCRGGRNAFGFTHKAAVGFPARGSGRRKGRDPRLGQLAGIFGRALRTITSPVPETTQIHDIDSVLPVVSMGKIVKNIVLLQLKTFVVAVPRSIPVLAGMVRRFKVWFWCLWRTGGQFAKAAPRGRAWPVAGTINMKGRSVKKLVCAAAPHQLLFGNHRGWAPGNRFAGSLDWGWGRFAF